VTTRRTSAHSPARAPDAGDRDWESPGRRGRPAGDRAGRLRLAYCNITSAHRVCPEHIKITDNALIPDEGARGRPQYDRWSGSAPKISRRPAPKDTPEVPTRSRSHHASPRLGQGGLWPPGCLTGRPGGALRQGRLTWPGHLAKHGLGGARAGRAGVPPRGGCLLVRRGRLTVRASRPAAESCPAAGNRRCGPSPPTDVVPGRRGYSVAALAGWAPACGRRPRGLVRLHFWWFVLSRRFLRQVKGFHGPPPDISRGSDRRPVPGVTELFPVSSLGAQRADPGAGGGSWRRTSADAPRSPYLAFIVGPARGHRDRDDHLLLAGLAADRRRLLHLDAHRRIETVDQKLADDRSRDDPVGSLGRCCSTRCRTTFAKPVLTAVFLAVNGLILFGGERLRRRELAATAQPRPVTRDLGRRLAQTRPGPGQPPDGGRRVRPAQGR